MSTGKSKNKESIAGKLQNEKEATVLAALKQLEETGTSEIVAPLIEVYATSSSNDIKSAIEKLLSTLKVSGTEAHFMNAINNPEMSHIRRELISFMWSSGVEPVNEIATLTQIAIDGDFEEAFECFTLIDNLTSAVPEEVILDSITRIKQYLNTPQVGEKSALMKQLLLALENMRVEE